MPFLSGGDWEFGYETEDDTQIVYEFVRPGQTVDNWTERITVQTLNKAIGLGSVEGQIDSYRNSLDERCPGSTVDVIRQTPDGVIYESNIVNCEQGADEHALVRILDGSYNRFFVHYAVRGESTMTPERRAEWLEELMAFHIIF